VSAGVVGRHSPDVFSSGACILTDDRLPCLVLRSVTLNLYLISPLGIHLSLDGFLVSFLLAAALLSPSRPSCPVPVSPVPLQLALLVREPSTGPQGRFPDSLRGLNQKGWRLRLDRVLLDHLHPPPTPLPTPAGDGHPPLLERRQAALGGGS
jgi:hypothetical protein